MAEVKKKSKECLNVILPIQDALFVIGGKWRILILISLTHGNERFTDIEKSIPKLSSKVLAKELKDLEENQLIKRTVNTDYPTSIRYTLTPYAKTLEKVILELYHWGSNHRKKIMGV